MVGTVLDTSCSTRARKTSRERRSARWASGMALPPLTVACLVRGRARVWVWVRVRVRVRVRVSLDGGVPAKLGVPAGEHGHRALPPDVVRALRAPQLELHLLGTHGVEHEP